MGGLNGSVHVIFDSPRPSYAWTGCCSVAVAPGVIHDGACVGGCDGAIQEAAGGDAGGEAVGSVCATAGGTKEATGAYTCA
mmetsp:Transcript_16485/g.32765  ORF Transcript_16485/g.32765 Transcript_16485/m.32765 type:complete len:81 (-) Transcript_16485:1815-2057(-)